MSGNDVAGNQSPQRANSTQALQTFPSDNSLLLQQPRKHGTQQIELKFGLLSTDRSVCGSAAAKSLSQISVGQGSAADQSTSREEEKGQFKMSAAGQRMGRILGEILLMKYFFPDAKTRKVQKSRRKLFMNDMGFNLCTGKVVQQTTCFYHKESRELIEKICEEFPGTKRTQAEHLDILKLFNGMRFMEKVDQFNLQDKLDIAKSFKVKKFQPGERVFKTMDQLDSFNLILFGQVGIFYPDQNKIQNLTDPHTRIVYINEAETARRIQKRIALAKQQLEKRMTKQRFEEEDDETVNSTLGVFNQLVQCERKQSQVKSENPLFGVSVPEVLSTENPDTSKSRQLIIDRLKQLQLGKTVSHKDSLKRLPTPPQKIQRRGGGIKRPERKQVIRKKPAQSVVTEEDETLEIPDVDISKTQKVLTVHTCPIMRDSENQYEPLERHFGTLNHGMVFGESILLGPSSTAPRFYNAIAMTECAVLQLNLRDWNLVLNSQERKIFLEKMNFLNSIPEFYKKLQLPKSKQILLCDKMINVKFIKGSRPFNQGEPSTHIFIVKSGEFKVTKKVADDQESDEIQDFEKFVCNTKVMNERQKQKEVLKKFKTQVLGIFTAGHLLGIEDAYSNGKTYTTGAVCSSLEGEVYKVEAEALIKIFANYHLISKALKKSSADNNRNHQERITQINKSKSKILDNFKRESQYLAQSDGKSKRIDMIIEEIRAAKMSEQDRVSLQEISTENSKLDLTATQFTIAPPVMVTTPRTGNELRTALSPVRKNNNSPTPSAQPQLKQSTTPHIQRIFSSQAADNKRIVQIFERRNQRYSLQQPVSSHQQLKPLKTGFPVLLTSTQNLHQNQLLSSKATDSSQQRRLMKSARLRSVQNNLPQRSSRSCIKNLLNSCVSEQ